MKEIPNGATALIRALEEHGVEYIFGYSGGAVIPIFDALVTSKTKIKLILVRHEQGAAHMADGYARATGKPGVVLVTSGPGAGNVVSGLMTAHMDSVPMVVISGQQIRAMLGLDAFQEADIFNITMPVTKHNYLVKETNNIPRIVREAFHLATTGRPGPVLIDIPKDVSSQAFTGDFKAPISIPAYKSHSTVNSQDLKKVISEWQKAKKPLILAGHGVILAEASSKLFELAKLTNTPVATTLLGKGAVNETHSLSLGMVGMHGTVYANQALVDCDFLLNIGSRFDDRIIGTPETFCKNACIVHVDIDESEFGKMILPKYAIAADALDAVNGLLDQPAQDHAEWLNELEKCKIKYPLKYNNSNGLTMQYIIDKVFEITDGNAIISTDVGQHQMWASQFYKVKSPKNWLSSGGAGTMGYGFPAGIGAQIARPGSRVVAFVGDGGFQMTLYELATAVINKLPIIVIVLNNHYLGMVRQWQELFYDNRESGVNLAGNPDFALLAESYGATGITINSVAETEAKLIEAFKVKNGPVVINAEVVKSENVFPMVPPGSPLASIITEPPQTQLDKPTGST
jgi:acetolactate synthase-1/2/3 large subunit